MTGLECIAITLFLEARGEPLEGQHAVASVIWNRVEHEAWPNEACEVVKQKKQFAFRAESETKAGFKKLKEELTRVALLAKEYRTTHATYFMRTCAQPAGEACKRRISRKIKHVTTIGEHSFYVAD